MIKDNQVVCDKCGNLIVTVNIIGDKKQVIVPKGDLAFYTSKDLVDTLIGNCRKCGSTVSFPKSFLGVK